MRKVSDSTRPDSGSCSPGESASTGSSSEMFAHIKSANKKVRLLDVLRHYGIKIEKNYQRPEWSNNITCPLSNHKGAKERTPSFAYNFVRDHFFCFGCGKSGRAVEFISLYEGVTRTTVTERILAQYGEDISEEDFEYEDNISPILLEGAKFIQSEIQKHKNDPKKIKHIRKLIQWLDLYLAAKAPGHHITPDGLKSRLERIKEII